MIIKENGCAKLESYKVGDMMDSTKVRQPLETSRDGGPCPLASLNSSIFTRNITLDDRSTPKSSHSDIPDSDML